MKLEIYIVSLLSCIVIGMAHCHSNNAIIHDNNQCPPWFFYNAATTQCECYSSSSTDGIIKCTDEGALLKLGYCTTYKVGEGVYVSPCYYFKVDDHNTTEDNYIRLPNNISELNDYMCGPLNRKGLVCSECVDGFGPLVTSQRFKCSECTSAWYGVPLYLFLEFVPITIFYLIILLFQISMTSAPMLAFVLYSQIGVSILIRLTNSFTFEATYTSIFLSTLITFYGFWNLDFFRYIIPPFCLSPNLRIIHIIFLYYVSAFYPLCLIGLTWICIELHSRNSKPITWLWSKLNRCIFKYININFDSKNTVIDVFATFLLLSYAKFVFTCFRTLSYGFTLNVNNFTLQQTLHVESDPSVVFFSREHLPFVVVSLFIFLVTVLPLTLLLALYPIRAVRTLIFKCQLHNNVITSLNIFVEKFYSCYRDGLDGGKDMRSLASMYFVLRLIINLIIIDEISLSTSYTIAAVLYGGSSLMIALIRPYKKAYMTTIDSLILANMALITILLDKYSVQESSSFISTLYLLIGSILTTLPMLGITGFIIYKIFKKLMKKTPPFVQNLSCCFNKKRTNDIETSHQNGRDEYELPDRMLHPDMYEEDSEMNTERTDTEC